MVAIYFEVDSEVVIKRAVSRRSCIKCGEIYNLSFKKPAREGSCDKCSGSLEQRQDDKEEVVKARIEIYKKAIEPVLAFYKESNSLKMVDGSRSATEITTAIKNIIKS